VEKRKESLDQCLSPILDGEKFLTVKQFVEHPHFLSIKKAYDKGKDADGRKTNVHDKRRQIGGFKPEFSSFVLKNIEKIYDLLVIIMNVRILVKFVY
jgi:hypothetical protein